MFQVKLDDYILYDYRLDDLEHEDMTIQNARLSLEANKTNSFQFKINSNHRYFDKILKLKSIIKVYFKEDLLFRGRILEDKQGFNKSKNVDCEGELAFLLDSIYRPYNFLNRTISLREFIMDLLNNHNSQVKAFQRFKIGVIEIEDPNEKINFSCESDTKTWKIFEEKIIPTYGGYIFITYDEEEMPIFNIYKEPPFISNLDIEYGVNLLDINNLISAEDLATACIPRGAKLLDESGNETNIRLDISSVNEGKDYLIDEEKAKEFGVIYANPDDVTFDNITVASNLLEKGRDFLKNSVKLSQTIEIKSNYLKLEEDIQNFKFLYFVNIISQAHGFYAKYLLTKLELDLFNIGNTQITLGEIKKTLTDNSLTNNSNATKYVKTIEKIESNYESSDNVKKAISNITTKYEELDEFIDGDDWHQLQLTEEFEFDENENLQYKKSGNIVSIVGQINTTKEIEKESEVIITTLEDDYVPQKNLQFVCNTESMDKWILTINTNGNLIFSNYGITENINCLKDTKLFVNIIFLI